LSFSARGPRHRDRSRAGLNHAEIDQGANGEGGKTGSMASFGTIEGPIRLCAVFALLSGHSLCIVSPHCEWNKPELRYCSASVLRGLNRLAEAEACQRENVAICRRLVEQEGRTELANDLATALNNQGSVLRGLNRLPEAEACQRESVAIYRRLVEQEGRTELTGRLDDARRDHAQVQAMIRDAAHENSLQPS
jgi:hypothetical protein